MDKHFHFCKYPNPKYNFIIEFRKRNNIFLIEHCKIQDPVQVFCRLRPNPNYETNVCVSLLSHTNLMLIPPDDLKNRKTVQYSFNHIFAEDVSQKEVNISQETSSM